MERFFYNYKFNKIKSKVSHFKVFCILCNLLACCNAYSIEDNCNFLCQKVTDIQKQVTFYGAISGGYSRLQDAYEATGQSGLYRIALGSFFSLTKSIKLGSELGFQNSSKMLLKSESTSILGDNILPVSLSTATPIDLLGTIRIEPYKMFFVEVKGGAVHQNVSVSGADVKTDYAWLPEVQFSGGITLFSKNRISINYQRFMGKTPKLENLNEKTWESTLSGAPTMQAIFLTAAINL